MVNALYIRTRPWAPTWLPQWPVSLRQRKEYKQNATERTRGRKNAKLERVEVELLEFPQFRDEALAPWNQRHSRDAAVDTSEAGLINMPLCPSWSWSSLSSFYVYDICYLLLAGCSSTFLFYMLEEVGRGGVALDLGVRGGNVSPRGKMKVGLNRYVLPFDLTRRAYIGLTTLFDDGNQ